jgi:DNA-binding IscR family transcriptional regulator
VRLFKDNEKYKNDVYVAINGKTCVIRRGVWTRIRRKFALLLDQSEIQDLRTAELMEKEASRFADETRRRNA